MTDRPTTNAESWSGEPLKLGELRALSEGAVVWAWYKEHGERGPRINRPMRIIPSKDDLNYWDLDDGSSLAAAFAAQGEFDPETGGFGEPTDHSECFDEACGEGEMFLYHAVPTRKPAGRKRTKR